MKLAKYLIGPKIGFVFSATSKLFGGFFLWPRCFHERPNNKYEKLMDNKQHFNVHQAVSSQQLSISVSAALELCLAEFTPTQPHSKCE